MWATHDLAAFDNTTVKGKLIFWIDWPAAAAAASTKDKFMRAMWCIMFFVIVFRRVRQCDHQNKIKNIKIFLRKK